MSARTITRFAGRSLLGFAVILALVAMAGCQRPEVVAAEKRAAQQSVEMAVYTDKQTGCQYIGWEGGVALNPRIAADGKTHMGCKMADRSEAE